MIKNYIRIAWRNLRSHPFYTALNIFGLSLGIASGVILFLFVHYHLGFDTYHRKAGNLYRVVTELHLDDGSVKYEKGAPFAMSAAIRDEVPQVKQLAFLFGNYRDRSFTVSVQKPGTAQTGAPGKVQDKLFEEHRNVAFADRHWFDLFDYQWEAGDPRTALEEPNSAVLTHSQAEKYFGSSDPVGQTIRLDGKATMKITGVLKDNPGNTDMKVDVFVSLSSMKSFYPDLQPSIETSWGWINSSNSLFLLLPDGFSPKRADDVLATLAREHMGEMAKYFQFHLLPLKDLHFDLRYGGAIPRSLLTTLGIIGFFILIIACVNFINLSTAQNSRRVKEIGTRKILGSTSTGIFLQFMTETVCITLLAVVLSLLWVSLTLPVLNQWLQTGLQLRLFQDMALLKAMLSLVVFIILTAGIYPSILLSGFRPVDSLKSRSGSVKRPWLRKSLILLQNLVAQSLIICTLIITLQNNFLKNADLGFSKEAVVMVPVSASDKTDLGYLRNKLLNQPGIKDVSFCFRPPASEYFKAGTVKLDNRNWEKYSALTIPGDAHYLSTFGLQLVAGRNLAESDTVRDFLVSEDLVRKLGFSSPAGILGHELVAGALDDHRGIIVGVVKDFHFRSLHSQIEPIVLATFRPDYVYAGIKINTADQAKYIEEIKRIWQSAYPQNVFAYHYLDEQIAGFYKKEALLNKLIGGFAILAIVISCTGLLGLISLLTVQRTREIGVRKVIGASVANITLLLSMDFIKIVSTALVLASVLAWVTMSNWLQGFANRIAIPWWIFLLAGLCNLALALLTIGYHAIRAALANPVKSLRAE